MRSDQHNQMKHTEIRTNILQIWISYKIQRRNTFTQKKKTTWEILKIHEIDQYQKNSSLSKTKTKIATSSQRNHVENENSRNMRHWFRNRGWFESICSIVFSWTVVVSIVVTPFHLGCCVVGSIQQKPNSHQIDNVIIDTLIEFNLSLNIKSHRNGKYIWMLSKLID